MAELKRTLLQGKMEIDLDDRLIPNGTYRFGQNISVSTSEGTDRGAVENVRGNRMAASTFAVPDSVVSIGSVKDDLTDKIYWFFVGVSREGIYEFDISPDENGEPRNIVNRVLEFSTDKRVLNFQANTFITGANVIGDLLFWTDGVNPPRKINIKRFVSDLRIIGDQRQEVFVGAGNYYLPNNQGAYFIDNIGGVSDENYTATQGQTVFDITAVPVTASDIDVTVMVNEVSLDDDAFTFTTSEVTLVTPVNAGDGVRIAYRFTAQEASERSDANGVGAQLLSDIDPEYDVNGVPLVNLDTEDLNVSQRSAFHGDLISVAKRPPLFPPIIVTDASTIEVTATVESESFTATVNQGVFPLKKMFKDTTGLTVTIDGVPATIQEEQAFVHASDATTQFFYVTNEEGFATVIYRGLVNIAAGAEIEVIYTGVNDFDASENPAESGDYLYDNFVYFAYRYRYRDGEVTPLSPFSPPAFFPKPYDIDGSKRAVLSMVNSYNAIDIMYDAGDEEVVEVELVITSTDDLSLKSLATINKAQNNIESSTPYKRSTPTFRYDNNKVYATLPSDQLFRVYDDVPITAKAQEIVGNRLVYGNYVQNYNLTKLNAGGTYQDENGNEETLSPIVPRFLVQNKSTQRSASTIQAASSVKSDRDYQVGIVYIDREGRQTPVILGDGPTIGNDAASSSVHVPFDVHSNRNQLTVDIKSPAPYWATHYRFFIKQTLGTYYNVYPKAVAVSHDRNRIILRLDSEEVNKIGPDTRFTLKGTAGNGVAAVREVFKVDPYVADDQGNSVFTFNTTAEGDAILTQQNSDNLIKFDLPFDKAQQLTRQAFVSRQRFTNFATHNALPGQRIFDLTTLPNDGYKGIEISSITVAGDEEGLNTWTINEAEGTVTLAAAPVNGEQVVISFSWVRDDINTEAASDYYISIVPVDDGGLESFPQDTSVDDGVIFETIPQIDNVADIYYEHGETFRCLNGAHTTSKEDVIHSSERIQSIYTEQDTIPVGKEIGDVYEGDEGVIQVTLDKYFNCFSYPTGIEETKILGQFNENELRPGIKASTRNENYRQRRLTSWLIHSGVFNDDTELNRLNEFNVGANITKELDIAEGSIQKIHSRDTNLIVFQEDKVKNVPIQKNLIQTAGGVEILTRDSQFFGTESAYAGEYGISTNPESFCTYGSRIYFADKNRGAILRLSQDGITEISKLGVESYVRNNIIDADLIIGSYDDYYEQAHFTLRAYPDIPGQSPNLNSILLASNGSPDPRSECNRVVDLIDFKNYYIFQGIPNVLSLGDVVFVDRMAQTQFNGNYRWHRLQDPVGVFEDRWNRSIQISPYGVITGVENNCFVNQPPDLMRDSFDISTESFNNEIDACGNGIIDGQAYHNGLSTEPIVGDVIYEGRWDIIRSTRTGWYAISDGTTNSVIRLNNGLVERKILCSAIDAGRTRILGSHGQTYPTGTQINQIIADLCIQPFAEQIYWFDGEGLLPEVGDRFYDDNHTDEPANENATDTYYAFADGRYIRTQYEAESGDVFVREVGICSEIVCFNNPVDLVTQTGDNPFTFTFNGIDNEYDVTTEGATVSALMQTIPANNVTIEYVVEGQNRYPSSGTFKVNARLNNGLINFDSRISSDNKSELIAGSESITPLVLGTFEDGTFTSEDFTLPEPNSVNTSDIVFSDYENENIDDVRVLITNFCYGIERGLGTAFAWVHEVAGDGVLCGNSAALDAVYYNPSVLPIKYYENDALTVEWTKAAGQYGFAYVSPADSPLPDSGAIVTEIVTVNAEGERLSAFQCVDNNDTYGFYLGYTLSTDLVNQQIACNEGEPTSPIENQVFVYSDQPLTNFDDNTTGNRPNFLHTATGSPVVDGYYTDGIVIRQVTGGVVSDATPGSCALAVTATLTATSGVTGGTPVMTLQNSQGAFATWDGTGSVVQMDVGNVDDDWRIVARVYPPSGKQWADGPYLSIGGGASSSNPSGTEVYSGTFTLAQFSGTEPSETYHWTGQLEDTPDPVDEPGGVAFYLPSLTATSTVKNATITAVSGVSSQSGNTFYGPSTQQGFGGSIVLELVPDDGFQFVLTPVKSDGVESTTHTFVYSASNRNGTISWAPNVPPPTEVPPDEVDPDDTGTEEVPEDKTFSIIGSTDDPVRTSASTQSDTITEGSVTLTSTLTAKAGYVLQSHSPGITSLSHTFYYLSRNDGDSYPSDWTNVVAGRPSASVRVGSSASDTCTADFQTVYMNTGSLSSATAVYQSFDSTTQLAGAMYLTDDTSFRIWNGSSFTGTFVCEVDPMEPEEETFDDRSQAPYTHFSNSSQQNACSTGTTTTVYYGINAAEGGEGKLYAFQSTEFSTAAPAGYYRSAGSVYYWNGTSLSSTPYVCPSVSWSPNNPSRTYPGSQNQSGSLTIVGSAAVLTFQAQGGSAGIGPFSYDFGFEITNTATNVSNSYSLSGTNEIAFGTVDSTSFTLPVGSYTWTLDGVQAGDSEGLFGAVTVTAQQ